MAALLCVGAAVPWGAGAESSARSAPDRSTRPAVLPPGASQHTGADQLLQLPNGPVSVPAPSHFMSSSCK